MANRSILEKIEIPQLRPLLEAMRALDLSTPFKDGLRDIARGVVDEAVPHYSAHVSSRARASVVATSTGKEAQIKAGGLQAPEWQGNEYGGGRRPETRQFPPWLGQTGYAIWPAIRDRRDETERIMYKLINGLLEQKIRTG